MGYLEQFARNRRGKEKSEVLTARLPASLYSDFKTYCDELGLSISEAVCLLVEREMTTVDSEVTTENYSNEYKNKTNDYISSDDVVAATTEITTKPIVKKRSSDRATTGRFTTVQWRIDGNLPCPICNEWLASTNFSRHAKTVHNSTTQDMFTSDQYKEKIMVMVEEKKNLSTDI